MKRLREDVYVGSQFKRPFGSSRSEPYLQHQSGGGGGAAPIGGVAVDGGGLGGGAGTAAAMPKLTTNDALTYLKEVKDMFQDQRDKYDQFLDVMKDFKAQRINTDGVIGKVKELFRGHNNLILGFNTFLPKGYEITISNEEDVPQKKTVEFEEAINFVNKIKKRFQNDEHVYKSFLEILNMYRKEHKDIDEVYQEVASLFEDHLDLLDEFKRFLPDSPSMMSGQHAPVSRNSFERSPDMSLLRPPNVDKLCRRERMLTSHSDRGISLERPDMEEEKVVVKINKEQRRRGEKENKEKRNRDQDERETDMDVNGSKDLGLPRAPDRKKLARKVDDFVSNPNLVYDDKNALKNMYNQEFYFCEKVKETLCNSDDYQAFLKCLHIYSTEIINRNELKRLVGDLLGKYPDLMEGFSEFLERCENIDGFLAGFMSKKGQVSSSRQPKIEEKEKEKEREKEKEPKKEVEVTKEKERVKEKYTAKSIQELDLSSCQRCTPSYRLLPEDYPILSASQRSELGVEVLNDTWVSVTSGSEDYSFKHMRRNQYEESLFRCEDDRFELDMLLESVSSTAKRAEELLNGIVGDNKVNSEGPLCVEDHFTALNLRCIERLYGDHGLDVMEILRRNPSLALPVILTRLKQKQEEWTRCRTDFNKVWAEIYSKNHYKSLDHRSFYFKQQDSKSLNAKYLVTEIKEIKEKRQREEDALLAVAAGSRTPISPNLKFEYPDTVINDDIFKLIKFSCEEVCSSKDQISKVMKLYTRLVEPLLGLPPHPFTPDLSEDPPKPRPYHSRRSTGDLSENVSPDPYPKQQKQQRPFLNGDDSHKLLALANGDGFCKDGATGLLEHMDSVESRDPPGVIWATQKEPKHDILPPVLNLQTFNSILSLSSTSEGFHRKNGIDMMTSGRGAAVGNAMSSDDQELKHGITTSNVPLFEGDGGEGDGIRNAASCSGRYGEKTTGTCKIEKEEGEVSPVYDFEEDNFNFYGDGGGGAGGGVGVVKMKKGVERGRGGSKGKEDEEGCEDVGAENNGDADDENSGNGSEAGEDRSGSESGGDECSHEEEDEVEVEEEGKAVSEAEEEGEGEEEGSLFVGGAHNTPLPLPERHLSNARPLVKYSPLLPSNNPHGKTSLIFYGNDSFYVLFRLHQVLYERMLSARTNSKAGDSKWNTATTNTITNTTMVTKEGGSGDPPYARFMNTLYGLLDGSCDNARFEDDCRSIIGNHSYILFTLDKLIYKLVKQLQVSSTDEVDTRILQLYDYEKCRRPVRFSDSVYYENCRVLLHDDNIYRFETLGNPPGLSIQLMDSGTEKPEVVAVSIDPAFSAYLHNDFLSVPSSSKKDTPTSILLHRNKQKYTKLDEHAATSLAMENVRLVNGLECKISCTSSKISYVLDTEDCFFRTKRRRRRRSLSSCVRRRIERFHRFLSAAF